MLCVLRVEVETMWEPGGGWCVQMSRISVLVFIFIWTTFESWIFSFCFTLYHLACQICFDLCLVGGFTANMLSSSCDLPKRRKKNATCSISGVDAALECFFLGLFLLNVCYFFVFVLFRSMLLYRQCFVFSPFRALVIQSQFISDLHCVTNLKVFRRIAFFLCSFLSFALNVSVIDRLFLFCVFFSSISLK